MILDLIFQIAIEILVEVTILIIRKMINKRRNDLH